MNEDLGDHSFRTDHDFYNGLQQRPGLYFGHGSHPFERLEAFIRGMSFAVLLRESQREDIMAELFDFEKWLGSRLRDAPDAAVWYGAIKDRCQGDQLRAYAMFFELLSVFLEERKKQPGKEGQ